MRSHIQFITTPTVDTPGTGLILHFDDKRYFFGQAHEGLQRASLQHGSKLLKVREMFLTGRTEWRTVGGLLGTILTLADSAKASLTSQQDQLRVKREYALRRAREEEEHWLRTAESGKVKKPRPMRSLPEVVELTPEPLGIHGGPNITHMLATARSFVFRQGMPLDVDEYTAEKERTEPILDWQPTWQDSNVKVWAMPITSLDQSHTVASRQGTATSGKTISKKRNLENYINGQQQGLTDMKEEGEQINALDSVEYEAQNIREHIIHEMFKSDWRFDNLVETPLTDVKSRAPLFIRDQETKRLRAYEGPLPDGIAPAPDVNVFVRQPWPGALVAHLPPTKPSSTAMSYIVRNHKQRGKFMAQVAKDLGVPPVMNSQLARGHHVILDNGKVVTPDQVLEAGKEGGGVAIVDVPSTEFIPALLRRPEWYEEQIMTGVEAFIWILGRDVVQDQSLVQFMEEFKDFRHIFSSPDYCPNEFMMTSAACAGVRHHLIDPERYTLLQHHNISSNPVNTIAQVSTPVMAKSGLILQLEPSVTIQDHDVNQTVNLIHAVDQMPLEVHKLATRAKKDVAADNAQFPLEDQNLPSPDAEVICLGTGSALPSMHRNVAGTLLRVPGVGSYLFDAGENTLGQLKRIYSPEELIEVLRDLKMIWISHLHADHHLGMAAVIKAWYEVVHGQDHVKQHRVSVEDHSSHVDKVLDEGRRLFCVGSNDLMRWLYEYSSVEDYGYDQLVPLEVTALTSLTTHYANTKLEWDSVDLGFKSSKDVAITNAMRRATGLADLTACYVSHCLNAMAVAVTFPDGFKFSYSGDCRPSSNFAAIGKGSTVLVHEATFDDEMQGDAYAKKHSTISEAISVGAVMGARRIILTHFSQRYSKIPTMDDVQGSSVNLEQVEADDGGEQGPMHASDVPLEAEASSIGASQDHQPLSSTPQQPFTEYSTTGRSAIPAKFPRDRDTKIAFAFDYMRVKVKDIGSLEKFVPALRELYKADAVKPIDELRKTSLADSGLPSYLSNAESAEAEKGGNRNRSSKGSGGQHRTVASDDNVNSNNTAHQQPGTRNPAGIGSRQPGSVVRLGGKPILKRSELINHDEDTGKHALDGLVEDRVAPPP